MREFKLFIGGEWQAGAHVDEIRSPFHNEVVGRVHKADPEGVERAIVAGEKARGAMAALSAHDRREINRNIASGIAARKEEFAEVLSDEAGKPIGQARGEVDRGIQTFEFAAEESWRLAGESIHLDAVPTGKGRFGIVRRFPVGLVAAVAPFNFPLNLVAHKLAPAFATGCPVVLKPASQTPMTALLLGEVCHAAGLPAGGLNVVPCSRDAADAFTVDPRFKLLSFTGSPSVGWKMKERAGKKRVVLELGGNAFVVVAKDADLDVAAARTALGAYAYAGQVCISVQRILVDESVAKAFEAKLIAEIEKLGVGNPRDEGTVCGPLIDRGNAERIVEWIDEAKGKGAQVLTGGIRNDNVVTPALLRDVPNGVRLASEEAFGPVATMETFRTVEEAIAKVNASDFGLQTGVFTDSVRDIWKYFEGLHVGGVIHNDIPTFRVDNMPYGGIKDSGFGREGVSYAIDDYTEIRHLALKPA